MGTEAQGDDVAEHSAEISAKLAELPEAFQERFAGFRRRNPSFDEQFGWYEFHCCDAAAKVAALVKTADNIPAIANYTWEQIYAALPGIAEGHTEMSWHIVLDFAWQFLADETLIPKLHGALCPMVGCAACGCYATECHQDDDNEAIIDTDSMLVS